MEERELCVTECRVLLCDDQAIVGEALRQMLNGIENLVFRHVADAEVMVKAVEEFRPTVILQDLVLPSISGIDLVRQLRSSRAGSDVPIVLLSTTDDPKVKFDAFDAGASDYVVKFPERYELIGRIAYHSRAYHNLCDRETAHRLLAQKGRLEALGNLAAGIAHEINTPLQYISTNLAFVSEVLAPDDDSCGSCGPARFGELREALEETIDGIKEISRIVRAMKAFAHPGKQEKVRINVVDLIRDVAVLSRNEWKDFATFEVEEPPITEPVLCSPGGIAQVLLNLVMNSAHAIRERRAREDVPGKIRLEIGFDREMVEIVVSDNGGGIGESIREKIFTPFFTTKDRGQGSGQGLVLARSIVVEGHGGSLDFESKAGEGTRFILRIPRNPQGERES